MSHPDPMRDRADDDYHPEIVGAVAAVVLLIALGAFFGWLMWLTLVAR